MLSSLTDIAFLSCGGHGVISEAGTTWLARHWGHPLFPGTREWLALAAPSCLSGCSSPFGFREAGRRQKVKGKSAKWVLNALQHHRGGHLLLFAFYLLPFTFWLSRCVSALRRSYLDQGHGQAIEARMHGSAPWKTEETIVGLPRLLVLSVVSRFGGCHLSRTFPASFVLRT